MRRLLPLRSSQTRLRSRQCQYANIKTERDQDRPIKKPFLAEEAIPSSVERISVLRGYCARRNFVSRRPSTKQQRSSSTTHRMVGNNVYAGDVQAGWSCAGGVCAQRWSASLG